jgi:hypothetical protein
MEAMPSSTLIVHNVQKQCGLLAQEIMVEIIRESEVSIEGGHTEIFCKNRKACFFLPTANANMAKTRGSSISQN